METNSYNKINLIETIVKLKNKYRLVSKKSGKNLGEFPSKEQAEKRERQVQFFKHQNEETTMQVLDELSTETLKAHNEKLKSAPFPKNTYKAVQRILGKRRAAEKIHDKEVDDKAEKTGRVSEAELNTVDESDSAIDGADKGPISRASAKHGRIKPMSGTKTIATKIATILAKKVE